MTLHNFVLLTRYTGGRSTIGHSLDLVRVNVIFNSAAGARNNAQKIVVAFTDGKPNTVERIPSYELKRAGVAIIVVGLTKRASTQKLLSIASEPQYVFHMDNSNALSQLIELLGGGENALLLLRLFVLKSYNLRQCGYLQYAYTLQFNTVNFLHNLISSSISEYPALFTSKENKMASIFV